MCLEQIMDLGLAIPRPQVFQPIASSTLLLNMHFQYSLDSHTMPTV